MKKFCLMLSFFIMISFVSVSAEAKSPTHRYVILVIEGSTSTYTTDDIKAMKDADGFILLPAGALTGEACSFQSGYSTYLQGMKATIATTLSVSSSFDIYVGTPWTVGTNLSLPSSTQVDKFLSEVKNTLSSVSYTKNNKPKTANAWSDDVVGFYYSDEWWYGETTDASFKYLVDIGNKIHGNSKYYDTYSKAKMTMKKKFYWIPPYLSENYTDAGKPYYKISKLLKYQNKNKMLIFDYIVVQPGYYFGDTGADVFSYIQNWIKDGQINGVQIGNTKVGMEMEMDSDNGKNNTKTSRYAEYMTAMNTMAKNYKIPMVMYCDGAGALIAVKKYVTEFLEKNY